MEILSLLAISSLITFALNVMLTYYLIKNRTQENYSIAKEKSIIRFNLTQSEDKVEETNTTELLFTELLSHDRVSD